MNDLTERLERVKMLGDKAVELLIADLGDYTAYKELEEIVKIRVQLWIEIGQFVSLCYNEGIPLIVYKGEISDGSH